MKSHDLERYLAYALSHREPTVTIGGPGTGKTQIHLQVAQSLGMEVFPPLYLAMLDPVDIGGMNLPTQPDAQGKRRLERLLDDWLEPAFTATHPSLLLIDEFSQGSPSIQCAAAPLLDARRAGKHKLPDCVAIAATGNAREHRAGANNTLTHVISRATRVWLEVDPLAWIDRSIQDGIAPEIISFIKQYPSLLDVSLRANAKDSFEEIYQSGSAYENPRSWYTISRHLQQGLDQQLEQEVFEGVIGQGANLLLQPHLLLVRTSVDIQAVMAGQAWKFPPKMEIGARYAFVIGVGACSNSNTADRVVEIAQQLYHMKEGEYSEVLIQTAVKSFPNFPSTAAWDTLRKHPLGQAIIKARRV